MSDELLGDLRERVLQLSSPADGGVVDRLATIRALEELRSVLAAAQAGQVAELAAERRAAIEVEIATVPRPGVGSARRRAEAERRLVAEIGLARRVSPWLAGRFVTWACAAPTDTPQTFALLRSGVLSEQRAMTVHQLTAVLPPDDRRAVDAELAPGLPGWGNRKVDRETRAAVYRADPAGACDRAAYAETQRRVTTRPAPDCMGWLTVLASMPQIVACRAALEAAAKQARAAGDPRSRGQVMADTAVQRLTGKATAEVPVAIQLIITDRTLLGDDDTPARFADGTPYPAPMARDLALGHPGTTAAARSVRRLFTDPAGRLITAETTSRTFTPAMADLIRLRDNTCTTPWCDAPIQHIDHDDPHTHGGPTSIVNGRGKCVWCNETKADQPPPQPPPADTNPPPGRRKPRRTPLERRARRTLKAAARRPGILVDLPPHRSTVQQSP